MCVAKTRRAELPWFLAYLLLVFASRAVAYLVVWPDVISRSITNPYLEPLVSALWRILFWIVPTLLYLIYVNRCNRC